ncbi:MULTISPECIES: hypothetical protein [Enterococcus]|uniref:Monooxygenase n=1 Tax=Enterococcus gallinarum TaxID=1353 RepID=A0ABD4HMX5_ENTGA|nr:MULTISPECIES: hypothetical protein [Enterococcus]MBA0947996.1 hypothetical protein [Enterococcus gallinarum]MBA0961511.1 hypothetical protein [Enterococcus gallinarum]MBA0969424.1 hypothetical protein [Enterococcus gallinarum]MBA0972797.1 hypothetical protein [Enterococcus gallinarum]MCR1946003.1 hypothetical protein [Enterococcus gallinarum]
MKVQKGYLILVIPVIEEGTPSDSFWMTADMKTINGVTALWFDWTGDIRHTIYFETEEEARRIASIHSENLHPHFCDVVELDRKAIDFLKISKGKILENPELHPY